MSFRRSPAATLTGFADSGLTARCSCVLGVISVTLKALLVCRADLPLAGADPCQHRVEDALTLEELPLRAHLPPEEVLISQLRDILGGQHIVRAVMR